MPVCGTSKTTFATARGGRNLARRSSSWPARSTAITTAGPRSNGGSTSCSVRRSSRKRRMYRISDGPADPSKSEEAIPPAAPADAPGGPMDSGGTSTLEAPAPPPDGVALVKAGDLKAAEAAFREAIRRSPDDAGAWHNLGVVLATQGKLEP